MACGGCRKRKEEMLKRQQEAKINLINKPSSLSAQQRINLSRLPIKQPSANKLIFDAKQARLDRIAKRTIRIQKREQRRKEALLRAGLIQNSSNVITTNIVK